MGAERNPFMSLFACLRPALGLTTRATLSTNQIKAKTNRWDFSGFANLTLRLLKSFFSLKTKITTE